MPRRGLGAFRGASKWVLLVVWLVFGCLVFGHDWDQTPDDVGVTLVESHVHQSRAAGVIDGRHVN